MSASETRKTPRETRQELKSGGLITIAVAPGLLILGITLGLVADGRLFGIMFGVSTLLAFVGAALYASAWFYPDESGTAE